MDYRHGEVGEVSVDVLFDDFIKAGTCKHILSTFQQLCEELDIKHTTHRHFYRRLRNRITSWKAQTVWAKLDKRAGLKEYRKGEACSDTRVLVIGGGPCGLRMAIECALLGARVVLVEKRDSFSRNNVLHLWPYLITDLKNLGAKKFFGKFCAGAIDHISIRQLQCILMKAALILGVEIHCNVGFEGILEPPEDQSTHKVGWRCKVDPPDHPVSEYEFDVLIGADGKRNTLQGFKRKEFRGKLAIAITANFINRNTTEEASVEEISGVAFIFNQKFFKDLTEQTGIDLENIVYYKDDTHYFVMTAKKTSLLDKGVLIRDYPDTASLLSPNNVNRDSLMDYAREAADFSTNQQLPHLDYAINHYGQPDIAMFDFTSMFAAKNASRVIERNGHNLLTGLVGDSLLEPFWPTGSGCARGFLSCMDAAWMIRRWASGKMTPLQVLAERESIFLRLSQTTPENLHKNHHMYTLDPNTRYPNLNSKALIPEQLRHLYDCGDGTNMDEIIDIPAKRARNDDFVDSYTLLRWCQKLLNTGTFRTVHIVDLTSSWRNGFPLCYLINILKPNLLDMNTLNSKEATKNCQLAFDIAQKEFGIAPVMTGEEMTQCSATDKLAMISYLSQFYQRFRKDRASSFESPREDSHKSHKSPHHRLSILQKLRVSARFARSKKRKEKEGDKHETSFSKRRLKDNEVKETNGDVQLTKYNKLPMDEIANKLTVQTKSENFKQKEESLAAVKVSAMAELLVSKFKGQQEEPVKTSPATKRKQPGVLMAATKASEFCYFCKKRVYLMERMSAEGIFFHRECLKCSYCSAGLRLSNYSHERSHTGEVKFYCFRHQRPESRVQVRSRRKRSWLKDDSLKENIPKITIDTSDSPTPQRKKTDGSPKKVPSPLSPPLMPDSDYIKAKKTPERIEFENSIDGLQEEESEEELTEHNLRASMSSEAILSDGEEENMSDSDLESSDDDELTEVMEETFGLKKDLTLEEALEVVETLKRKSHENLIDAVNNEGKVKYMDSDEDDDTEVEGDSDFETDQDDEDTEMEDDVWEEAEEEQAPAVTPNNKLSLNIPPPDPSNVECKARRANFFTTPPEVVRLDPWKMFGMGETNEDINKIPKSEDSEEVITTQPHAAADMIGSDTEATDRQIKTEILDEDENKERQEEVMARADEDDQRTDEECDEVFDSEEDGEDVDDKDALKYEMEKLLVDIDHKSSASGESVPDILKTDEEEVHSSSAEEDGEVAGVEVGMLEDTEQAVLRSVQQMSENGSSSSGRTTLQDVLNSVEGMNAEDERINLQDFTGVDDRFITRTRGGRKGVVKKKKRPTYRDSVGSDSSFTISTPSHSGRSSVSSLSSELDHNQPYGGEDENEEKPDEDLLRDYQLTLSQALGEDYSDSTTPRDNGNQDNLDETLQAEQEELDSSIVDKEKSFYATPNASASDKSANISDKYSSANENFSEMSPDAVFNDDLTKTNSNGSAWRPLPPPPPVDNNDNVKSSTKSLTKRQNSTESGGDSGKEGRTSTGRQLPDISNLTSKVSEQGFQSKFMKKKIGSPTSTMTSGDSTTSGKESSSSPEMKFKHRSVSTDSSRNNYTSSSSTSGDKDRVPKSKEKKMRVSVDHTKLRALSSYEDSSSQNEEAGDRKKKIGIDSRLKSKMKEEIYKPRVSVGEHMVDDIPFADDSEEDPHYDNFYTPATSVKSRPAPAMKRPSPQRDIRKRILPTPPNQGESTPAVPTIDHIRQLKRTDMDKAREKAREKARLKSDEELGLANMGYTPVAGHKGHRYRRGNSSTPSTSDQVLSDSDDNHIKLKVLHSTPNGEVVLPPKFTKDKKTKQFDNSTNGKSTDKSDTETKSTNKKRKSLLQMLRPGKEKNKDFKDKRSSSNDTLDEKSEKKVKKTPKSDKKKKKTHKSEGDALDKGLSEGMQDLKIVGSMFGQKDTPTGRRPGHAVRRTVAPRADLEEFSDSDESHVSVDTTLSRRSRDRRTMSEDEVNVKIARRVQSAAKKQQKQREQKRLRMAQEIQRQLEEVDVKQRELEERGVSIEKALRGEGPDAEREEKELMQEWFNLVYEKNALVRYESELMVNAQYMELEDRHGRLEQKLRERMAMDNIVKTQEQAAEEKRILDELLQVVEERNNLVAMLEEDRLREREEDSELKSMMQNKGFNLSPLDSTRKLRDSQGFPLSC
ncbi:protein-methionine sulfoxide oxidase mical3b-like isoform X4 [Mizuhopecten yessoensis]|uniref:F-actin monooxygenase n=1 Tax=Mizuhopecten yessoensis TaxID=6573 RepID=A0A210Q7K0_MIZYE|nr:protein-methionine sulfoxide oxidase mical3b-like isoform X4 [Mizuhopecten yessoensis]OWF44716.1 Protein-methionine sulfoxide oxidase MICAL3 [Mizuhopecten yessoensis]